MNGFMQLYNVNADFNTDNRQIQHISSIGRVVDISSAYAVSPEVPIQIMARIPASNVVAKLGHGNSKHFEAKEVSYGLKEIKIKDLFYKFGACQSTYRSAIETLLLFSKQR